MARTKYPPVKVTGVRPNGLTPPEQMSDEERRVYFTNECIIMAQKMGGVPKEEAIRQLKNAE